MRRKGGVDRIKVPEKNATRISRARANASRQRDDDDDDGDAVDGISE